MALVHKLFAKKNVGKHYRIRNVCRRTIWIKIRHKLNMSMFFLFRISVLGAKGLLRKDFFRLPDPFCKLTVDGGPDIAGQNFSTAVCRATLDPRWSQNFDMYITNQTSVSSPKVYSFHRADKIICGRYIKIFLEV